MKAMDPIPGAGGDGGGLRRVLHLVDLLGEEEVDGLHLVDVPRRVIAEDERLIAALELFSREQKTLRMSPAPPSSSVAWP